MLSFRDRLEREAEREFDNRGFTFKREGEESLLSSIIKSARQEAQRSQELDTYSQEPSNPFHVFSERLDRQRTLDYRSQKRREDTERRREEESGGGGLFGKGLSFVTDKVKDTINPVGRLSSTLGVDDMIKSTGRSLFNRFDDETRGEAGKWGMRGLDAINYAGDVVTGTMVTPLGELKKRPDGTFDRDYTLKSISEGLGRLAGDTLTLGHAGLQDAHRERESAIYGYDPTSNPIEALNRLRTEGQQFYEDEGVPTSVKVGVGYFSDPTTYVGIGAAGKAARGLQKAGPLGEVASLPLRGKRNPIGAILEGPGTGRAIAGGGIGAMAGSEIAERAGVPYVPDEFEGMVGAVIGGIGGATAFTIRRPQPTLNRNRVPDRTLEIVDEAGNIAGEVSYARRTSPVFADRPEIDHNTVNEELRLMIARNMAGELPSGRDQIVREIDENFGTHYQKIIDAKIREATEWDAKGDALDALNRPYKESAKQAFREARQWMEELDAQRKLAKEIIDVIPDEYLTGVRIDFTEGYTFTTKIGSAKTASGVHLKGVDHTGDAIDPTVARGAIIIAEEAVTRPWNATNVLAHEIAHQIESILPSDSWARLVRQYSAEHAVLSKHYIVNNNAGSNPTWYQTTAGFGEWFAERLGEQITSTALARFVEKYTGPEAPAAVDGLIAMYQKMFSKLENYRESTGYLHDRTGTVMGLGIPKDYLGLGASAGDELSNILTRLTWGDIDNVQKNRRRAYSVKSRETQSYGNTLDGLKVLYEDAQSAVADKFLAQREALESGWGSTGTSVRNPGNTSYATDPRARMKLEQSQQEFVDAMAEAHPFAVMALIRNADANGEDFSKLGQMYQINTTSSLDSLEYEVYIDRYTKNLRVMDYTIKNHLKENGISDAWFREMDEPATSLSVRPYEIDGTINREAIPELERYAESATGPLDKIDNQRHAIQMSQVPPDEPPVLKEYADNGGDLPRKPTSNKFLTSLGNSATFEADAARVRDYKIPFVKKLLSMFINPSAAMTSPAGRGLIAYQVWKVKAKSAVGATLSSAIDIFDERFTGRQQTGLLGSVFRTNIDGTIRNMSVASETMGGKRTPLHWADLFEAYRADPIRTSRKYNLDPQQSRLIDNFWQVLTEANLELQSRGINQFETIERIPRSIRQIDDIKVNWKTNHLMERVFNLASDGVANGVVYNDYRKTLGLYLSAAYEEIAEYELGQYLMKHGVTSIDLSKAEYDQFKEASIKRSQASERMNAAHKALNLDPSNEMLKKEWDKAVENVKKAKLLAEAAENTYRQKVRELTNPEVGKVLLDGKLFGRNDGKVATKAWRNKYMTQPRPGFPNEKMAVQAYWNKEDYEQIVKYMGAGGAMPDANKVGPVARAVQTVGGAVRFLSASTDFAGWAVHGIPVLALNPASWARMAYAQFAAFADTAFAPRYIADHKKSIDDMIKHGVPIDTELFEAVEEGSLFRKLTGPLEAKKGIGPTVAEPGKTTGRQTYGRFQSSFASSLLVARTSMWEAMIPFYKGREHQLAQLIRNATGGLDSGALGVTRGQAAYEAAWMAFSPRLLRSTFGLTAMALDPTLNNRGAWHARAALMTMAAGGAGLYYGIGMAMGKSDEELRVGLDPRNGKRFLSYNINGDWIGIGGQFRALTQFAVNSGAAAVNGEWSKFTDASYYENPILNFWTSRGSVGLNLVGAPLEAWTGADFLPYKDIESPTDTFKHLGRSVLPFSVQGMIEGDSTQGTIASMLGARVSPETPTEQRTRQLNEMFPEKLAEAQIGATGKPEVTWEDLNKEERRRYNEAYPFDGDVEINNISRYYDGFKTIEQQFNDKVARAEAVVSLGLPGRDKAWFREEYRKYQIEKYAAIDHHREIFSALPAERRGFEGSVTDYLASRNTQPEDQAVEAWYDLPKKSLGPDGLLDFDKLEENRQKFLAELPQNVRDYVARTVTSPAAVSPVGLLAEYEDVKAKTLAYFEAPETMFDIVRDASPFFGSFRSYDEIRDFITKLAERSGVGETTITSLLEKKIPEFKKFNEAVSTYRKIIRLADPELDIYLKEWYRYETANPLLPAVKASGADWERFGRETAPIMMSDRPITRAQAGRLGLQLAAQRGDNLSPTGGQRTVTPESLRYGANKITSPLSFRN